MFRKSANQNGSVGNNEYNDNSNQFYQKIHSPSAASNYQMLTSLSYLDFSNQPQKSSFLTKLREFFAKTQFFSLRRTQSPPSQNSQKPKRAFFRKPLASFFCTKALQEKLFEQNNLDTSKNNEKQINDKIYNGISGTSESKIETEQNEQISNNKTINKDRDELISNKNNLNGSNKKKIQEDEQKKQNPTLMEQNVLEGSKSEFEKQNFQNDSNLQLQNQNQQKENNSIVKPENKVVKKVRFQLPEKEEWFQNWDDLSFSDESFDEEETYQRNWLFGKQEQSSSCMTTALLSFI